MVSTVPDGWYARGRPWSATARGRRPTPLGGTPTLDDPTLYAAAGASAVVALVALVIAGVTIALFFGGRGDFWGPVNDVFTAVMLVALILPILAVDRLGGGDASSWLRAATVAACIGAVIAAAGQVALVGGLIDLRASFVTGGIGIAPVLGWMVAVVVLAGPVGALPETLGATAGGSLLLVAVGAVVASATRGRAVAVAWALVGVLLVAFVLDLAAVILSHAAG